MTNALDDNSQLPHVGLSQIKGNTSQRPSAWRKYIDNMSPFALKRLRLVLGIVSLVIIVAIIIISYYQLESQFAYSFSGSSSRPEISIWNNFYPTFIPLLFFLIIATSALRWPIAGGAFILAVGVYLCLGRLTYLIRFAIDAGSRPGYTSSIPGYSHTIAIVVIAFLLLACGIAIMLIGYRELRSMTPLPLPQQPDIYSPSQPELTQSQSTVHYETSKDREVAGLIRQFINGKTVTFGRFYLSQAGLLIKGKSRKEVIEWGSIKGYDILEDNLYIDYEVVENGSIRKLTRDLGKLDDILNIDLVKNTIAHAIDSEDFARDFGAEKIPLLTN